MLEFKTTNFTEIFKQCFISKRISGEDETIPLVKILKASKANNIVTTKEIWPAAPMVLNMTANHELWAARAAMKNSQYSGPRLKQEDLITQPLKLTVTPYPENSAWKFGHSDNIKDSAAFHTVHYGTQEITLSFILENPTGDWEDTWISAESAVEGSPVKPGDIKFRFWYKQASNNPSGGGEQSGQEEQEVIPQNGPVLKWTFNTSTPAIDIVRGVKLEAVHDSRDMSQNLINDETYSLSGKALRSVLTDAVKYISVGATDYRYMATAYQDAATYAKYGWYDADTTQIIYTPSLTPAVGSLAYSADEQTTYTITDVWETNDNKWSAVTGIGIEDPTKEWTLNGYIRPNRGVSFGFFGEGYKTWSCIMGFDTAYHTNWHGFATANNGTGNRNFPGTKWTMLTCYISPQFDASDPANAYTEERGWGIIESYGHRFQDGDGTVYWPYVRDESNDVSGRCAWTWIDAGWSDNKTPPSGFGTLYTPTSSIANDDKLYDSSGSEVTGWKVRLIDQLYRVTFRDTRFGRSETPFEISWGNNYNNSSSPYKNDQKIMKYWIFWVNGNLVLDRKHEVVVKSGGFTSYQDKFTVEVMPTDTSDQSDKGLNWSAIDEISIYDRMLTEEELVEMASVTGAEAGGGTSSGSLTSKYISSITPQKIKIGSSNLWYRYNPLLTSYQPTANDDTAAHFGWEKITGEGPEHIWTEKYPIGDNDLGSFAILEPGGAVNSAYSISATATLPAAEYPHDFDLVPHILDDHTIAVVVVTHRAVMRMIRTRHPNIEGLFYNTTKGWYDASNSAYAWGENFNCAVWDAQSFVITQLCAAADIESNWTVDGNPCTLRARHFTTPTAFRPSIMQWRNCKPGDKWYYSDTHIPTDNYQAPEHMQIAYLTLPEPMTQGSTHTVEFQGCTCSIKYDPEKYCATIKVNQEGYMPYPGVKRYAYVGRYMGSDTYMPANDARTFHLVPTSTNKNSTITDPIFTGTMTQRCIFASNRGVCSDLYGTGSYAATKPLNGENTFELDFSNLTTCSKNKIVVNGVSYFRDSIEDEMAGSIIVNSITYYRNNKKDTCNCYAWSKLANAAGDVELLYTEMKVPEVGDLCKLGYDDELNENYTISSVSNKTYYAWTTERTVEADWGTSTTIWTDGATTDTNVANNTVTNIRAYTDWTYPLAGDSLNVTSYSANEVTADLTGEYQIYIPHIGWSHKFLLSPEAMAKAAFVHERGIFHWRSGNPYAKHPYTNWEHKSPGIDGTSGHEVIYAAEFDPNNNQATNSEEIFEVDPETHEPVLDATGAKISFMDVGKVFSQNGVYDKQDVPRKYGLYGGWFDAADFDMRETHIKCIRHFADAYILFPDNFYDGQWFLPESGDGIPDILHEAMWGAELYRKTQQPDGGIRGWFEASGHESDWPWMSKKKYYMSFVSQNHSIRWAEAAARLASAFRVAATKVTSPEAVKKCKVLEKTYAESAINAFNFATQEFYEPYKADYTNRPKARYIEVNGKTYCWKEWISCVNSDNYSTNVAFKEFGLTVFRAAVACYALTKEQRFKEYITPYWVSIYLSSTNSPDSADTSNNVCVAFLRELDEELPTIAQQFRNQYVTLADKWLVKQNKHAYRMYGYDPGTGNMKFYGWANSHYSTYSLALIMAWLITGNEKYRSSVLNAIDHAQGCNGLGRTWTTHLGKIYLNRALDHWVHRHMINDNKSWDMIQGLTSDHYGQNQQFSLADYNICARTIGQQFPGRAWLGQVRLNAYPRLLKERYNFNASSYEQVLYYSHLPFHTVGLLYCLESLHVMLSEYTIDSTIVPKITTTGMMLAPRTRSRVAWTQDGPVGYNDYLEQFAMLP